MFNFPPYTPVGAHTQVTGLSSVKTLYCPQGATGLLVQATGQNVRLKLVGTPTASSGFQIRAGDPAVYIPLSQQRDVYVIQETATATVEYQAVKLG